MSDNLSIKNPVYGIIGNQRVPERALRGLRQCPYCRKQIHASHFPLHLIKCGQKDPTSMQLFAVCQYDYSHHILKKDMAEHLKGCPARDAFLFHEIKGGNGSLEDQMNEIKAKMLNMKSEHERKKRLQQMINERENHMAALMDKQNLRVKQQRKQSCETKITHADLKGKSCEISKVLPVESSEEDDRGNGQQNNNYDSQHQSYLQRISNSVRNYFTL